MGNWNQQLGRKGEDLAAAYLEENGWRILHSRYRTPVGEIDLIAEQGETLAFFEVKCRKSEECGDPLLAITPNKLRHFIRAIKSFLALRPDQRNRPLYLGAIGLWQRDGGWKLREEPIRDAFEF